MSTETSRPILVTGAHRSGTTWVGRMLAAGPGLAYISEPLNVLHRPGVFAAPVRYWYTYICNDNQAEFLPAFEQLNDFDYHLWAEIRSLRSAKDFFRMLRDFGIFYRGSLRGQRLLLKDPFAILSLPWFAERLRCQIVVTVRHPAGFASSLKRLGWSFDFKDLLSQPLLMRDQLEAYRGQMGKIDADDVVGQAGLLWALLYGSVGTSQRRVPGIQIVRHEDLSLDPVPGFRKLYDVLGLGFTGNVRTAIEKSSSTRNPSELGRGQQHSVQLDSRASLGNWKKRLTAEEIARLRDLTRDVAPLYYAEESWS